MKVAIHSGISISRWSNAVNVLIEKDPGQPQLTAYYPYVRSGLESLSEVTVGPMPSLTALDLNLLHNGQHGSIPRRTARIQSCSRI